MRQRVKAITILVVLAMMVGLLAGCGSPAGKQKEAEKEQPKEQEKIILKLGGGLAETHPHTITHKEFAKLVKEKTNGRVEIQVFPNNQLGQQRALVEGMQMGTIDMGKSMTAVVANVLPEIMVFDLPYIFRDREHFYKVVDGPIGQSFLNEKMEKVGLKGLLFYDAGSRSIYNSKRPITKPEDLKGLKIRVPENPLMVETINAMGGTGVPMGLAEIYTGLQQGIIDGAENAPLFAYQQKHHEVTKYFSMTDHFRTPDVLMISLKVWNKLPADIQEAILEAAEEIKDYQRQLWIEQEKEVVEKLKAEGMEFNDVDQAPFREAVKTVWKKYEDKIGKDLIEAVANTK